MGAATPSTRLPELLRLTNPTIQQLDEHEQKLQSGAITTPIIVNGMIPEWVPKVESTIWHQLYDGAQPKIPTEWQLATEKIIGI
jgi:hypothetical protein